MPDWVDSFPYRAKALFAFEVIDGTDVCFFGMHVQEYGSECAPPNTRQVSFFIMKTFYIFYNNLFLTIDECIWRTSIQFTFSAQSNIELLCIMKFYWATLTTPNNSAIRWRTFGLVLPLKVMIYFVCL